MVRNLDRIMMVIFYYLSLLVVVLPGFVAGSFSYTSYTQTEQYLPRDEAKEICLSNIGRGICKSMNQSVIWDFLTEVCESCPYDVVVLSSNGTSVDGTISKPYKELVYEEPSNPLSSDPLSDPASVASINKRSSDPLSDPASVASINKRSSDPLSDPASVASINKRSWYTVKDVVQDIGNSIEKNDHFGVTYYEVSYEIRPRIERCSFNPNLLKLAWFIHSAYMSILRLAGSYSEIMYEQNKRARILQTISWQNESGEKNRTYLVRPRTLTKRAFLKEATKHGTERKEIPTNDTTSSVKNDDTTTYKTTYSSNTSNTTNNNTANTTNNNFKSFNSTELSTQAFDFNYFFDTIQYLEGNTEKTPFQIKDELNTIIRKTARDDGGTARNDGKSTVGNMIPSTVVNMIPGNLPSTDFSTYYMDKTPYVGISEISKQLPQEGIRGIAHDMHQAIESTSGYLDQIKGMEAEQYYIVLPEIGKFSTVISKEAKKEAKKKKSDDNNGPNYCQKHIKINNPHDRNRFCKFPTLYNPVLKDSPYGKIYHEIYRGREIEYRQFFVQNEIQYGIEGEKKDEGIEGEKKDEGIEGEKKDGGIEKKKDFAGSWKIFSFLFQRRLCIIVMLAAMQILMQWFRNVPAVRMDLHTLAELLTTIEPHRSLAPFPLDFQLVSIYLNFIPIRDRVVASSSGNVMKSGDLLSSDLPLVKSPQQSEIESSFLSTEVFFTSSCTPMASSSRKSSSKSESSTMITKFVYDIYIDPRCDGETRDSILVKRCKKMRETSIDPIKRYGLPSPKITSNNNLEISSPYDLLCPKEISNRWNNLKNSKDIISSSTMKENVKERDPSEGRDKFSNMNEIHHHCNTLGMWKTLMAPRHKCIAITIGKFLNMKPGNSVFDFGSGCGHTTGWLTHFFGIESISLDPNISGINWASSFSPGKHCRVNKYLTHKIEEWIPDTVSSDTVSSDTTTKSLTERSLTERSLTERLEETNNKNGDDNGEDDNLSDKSSKSKLEIMQEVYKSMYMSDSSIFESYDIIPDSKKILSNSSSRRTIFRGFDHVLACSALSTISVHKQCDVIYESIKRLRPGGNMWIGCARNKLIDVTLEEIDFLLQYGNVIDEYVKMNLNRGLMVLPGMGAHASNDGQATKWDFTGTSDNSKFTGTIVANDQNHPFLTKKFKENLNENLLNTFLEKLKLKINDSSKDDSLKDLQLRGKEAVLKFYDGLLGKHPKGMSWCIDTLSAQAVLNCMDVKEIINQEMNVVKGKEKRNYRVGTNTKSSSPIFDVKDTENRQDIQENQDTIIRNTKRYPKSHWHSLLDFTVLYDEELFGKEGWGKRSVPWKAMESGIPNLIIHRK